MADFRKLVLMLAIAPLFFVNFADRTSTGPPPARQEAVTMTNSEVTPSVPVPGAMAVATNRAEVAIVASPALSVDKVYMRNALLTRKTDANEATTWKILIATRTRTPSANALAQRTCARSDANRPRMSAGTPAG